MKPRIAVLDDEERMVEILAMVLRREGYEVHAFQQGKSALEALESQPFDLLLTDLKMPGLDGIEVLRRAKALDPKLPVILVTAHATGTDLAVDEITALTDALLAELKANLSTFRQNDYIAARNFVTSLAHEARQLQQ